MARNLPVGLREVLKSGYAESHSTLELSLPSDIAPAINLYFATARLTIDGVTYDQQLRSADAVKTSLTRAADRVTVELQNVDTILGVDLLAVADTLYGANVQFGRYWKDLNSKAAFHHILLTGAVAGVEINENVARLTLISDTYAAVSVGAKEQVIRTCRFQVQGEFRGTKCGYTGAKLTCNGLIDDADGCDGRHGDPLKRAKFGGFVYIEGKSSVAGAVALPIPASNQAIRTVATDLGSYASPVVQQPFLSVNEETFHVSNDATNEQTVITPKGIPTGFIHPVFDKGAATDGTTNVTTPLTNAVADAENASLNYPPITLPPGTFTISQLDLDNNVTIVGAGKGKTVLKSTGANSAVLKITTGGNRVVLRGLTIEGTGAGSSQHGLEIVGSSPADIVVEDVDVTNVGGRAVYLNSPSSAIFSSVFKNITAVNWNMAATAGVPAFDIDTDGPCVLLENCYAKDTSSANAIGFRIRRGQTRTIKLESCNGIDPSGSGSIWAIVGQHTSLGDASTSVAYCTFSNCNVEAFTATGIEVRGSGSVINLIGANNFTAGGNGVRPIWFRSATVAGASPGIFDPQTIFANADTAATTYANGQAIESEGIPPLICLAPAGQFGSFSGWTTYWDTSLATDSTQPLRRLDALNRVAPTATYTIESQGTRLVDLRHSAPATVTLMYGGYMRPGEWVVIKDGGGVAATHNITISAGGGSTIDGAGSVVLNTNYASLLVYSDGANWLTWGGGGSSSGANTALSNLASVAINTSLLPGTDNAIDLGSSSKQWRRGYFGTAIVMANGATTVGGQNWTITGGASPQYALSDGTVSARVQLLSGSYLQLGTTSNHNTLFLHNGTGVFTLRAVGLIPETTDTYQFGGDSNRWTDGFFSGSINLKERTAPSTPSANTVVLYAKDKAGASALYFKNDAGTETEIGSGGGGGTVTTVSVVSANGFGGSVANATTTPAITLTTSITGLLKGNGTAISAAVAGTDYENPLTFSTGLTRSTNTITVNTSQNITTLSNLTSNGFVKTSGGVGTLSIDTSTYLTANQTITLSGDVSGSGSTAITATLATVNSNVGTFGSATQVAQVTVNAKGLITAASNVTITGTSPVGSSLTSGSLWIGNGSNVAAAVAMSGDVTITNAGVTAIGALKVTNAMLAGSITDDKLSQLVTPDKVADSALTTNVPLLNTTNTFTGGKQSIVLTDAATVTVTDLLDLQHVGGVTGTSFGSGIRFGLESANGTANRQAANLNVQWTTATDASRTAKFVVQLANSGTVGDRFTVAGNGDITATGNATAVVINGTTGFRVNSAAVSGTILRGNGTNYIASTYTMAAPGTSGNVLTSDGTNWVSSTPAAAGVTSVAQSFTGGLISVAGSPITSSGTLALTVAGTSGGIPYFSSASTWATSAALAANAIVIGGGVGAAPSTTTTGTGVLTALGVATGSAGAFVVNGGALGTPSSGVGSNLTALNGSNISSGTIAVTVGGTGRTTSTTAYGLIAAGTTPTGAHQTLAAGATTEILVGGGTSALPVWTTATGSGSPVRATSPTLITPTIAKIANLTTNGVITTTSGDGTLVVDDNALDYLYSLSCP